LAVIVAILSRFGIMAGTFVPLFLTALRGDMIRPTCPNIPWKRVTHLVLGKNSPDSYVLYAMFKGEGGEKQYAIEPFDSLSDAIINSVGYFEQKNKKRANKLSFRVTDEVYEDCCRLHRANDFVVQYKMHDLAGVVGT
jgi:hypothetical protein